MENKHKIYVKFMADREPLALLLIKSGYIVRIGDEKVQSGTSKKTLYFVEYWE